MQCKGKTGCLVRLQHERKVYVFHPITDVDVSVLWGHWNMVESEATPQEAAQRAHFAGTFELETPLS